MNGNSLENLGKFVLKISNNIHFKINEKSLTDQ